MLEFRVTVGKTLFYKGRQHIMIAPLIQFPVLNVDRTVGNSGGENFVLTRGNLQHNWEGGCWTPVLTG